MPDYAEMPPIAADASTGMSPSISSGPARAPGIIAVVKANAYGHGAARVGARVGSGGRALLACADIEEGVVLRARRRAASPILVFGALSVSDLDGVFDYRADADDLDSGGGARAAGRRRRARAPLRYHLKIDTGMNRLGFRLDNLGRTLPELLASPNLSSKRSTPTSPPPTIPVAAVRGSSAQRFERGAGRRRRPAAAHRCRGIGPVRVPSRRQQRGAAARLARLVRLVRPGLLLYGIVPPPLATTVAAAPVMTLVSRVVAVKGLRPGEGVGYGVTSRAERPTTIAVVPAGYADGLDAAAGRPRFVLVRGRRAPIVGSVCMDMLMIDVTGLEVAPGDEVVIVGAQGGDRIDVREMAASIGTIPWEVVCRVGARIERVTRDYESESVQNQNREAGLLQQSELRTDVSP